MRPLFSLGFKNYFCKTSLVWVTIRGTSRREELMDRFEMRAPDDFHLHLREGKVIRQLGPLAAAVFRRALVMPNLFVPILDGCGAVHYEAQIAGMLRTEYPNFAPLMTIQITERTTWQMIAIAQVAKVVAGKIYPRNMTTNSENGVEDYTKIYPALEAMQYYGMVACFHGESPDPKVDPIDRERRFKSTIVRIARKFPRLKIVMEHITDRNSIKIVRDLPSVAATITVHHLLLTMTDWHGRKLKPHLFCKPEAKRFADRDALREAAFSGESKFFLGTDSAPHPKEMKECADGCAGIFTAPVAIPLLIELFEEHGALDKLEAFCSEHGANFYNLPLNDGRVVYEQKPWEVPAAYDNFVPFKAGETLQWQLVK